MKKDYSLSRFHQKKKYPCIKINSNQFTIKDTADFLVISFTQKENALAEMTVTQNRGKINTLTQIE